MVTVWRRVWRWLAATFAVVVILMALVVGAFRLFLSQTPEYAAQIESWAGDVLGLDVSIGSIDARWGFAGPEISFLNTVLSQDGKTLVQARRGRVAVRVLPLLRGEVTPSRVILEDTRIDIKRNQDGGLFVAGQDVLSTGQDSNDWDATLPQGVFELRDATISYTDVKRNETYVFKDVALRLNNESNVISLKGGIGLPEPLGDSVTFAIDTNDKLKDKKRWRLHVDAENIDLSSWMMLGQWNHLGIASGYANANLSAAFVGDRVELANGSFSLTNLELSQGEGSAFYDAVGGELDWDRQAQGWRISVRDFQIQRGARIWDPVSMSLDLTSSDQDLNQVIYANADYLNLNDLVPLLSRIPMEELREGLIGFSPNGEVRDVLFNASRRDGNWGAFTLRSEFQNLGTRAVGKIPGLSGLAGTVRMDRSGGNLQLASSQVVVNMPKVFRGPLKFDQVEGDINWRFDGTAYTVQSKDLQIFNADARTNTRFRLLLPGEEKIPTLELRSDVRDALVARAKPYLPKSKIPPKTLKWLDGALAAGRIPEGVVTFKGPIRGFPFDKGEGDFKAAFTVQNLKLDYSKDWPALERSTADVVFHNAKLTAKVSQGTVASNPVNNSRVEVSDLRLGVVDIDGHSNTKLSQLLDFVIASPIRHRFGTNFDDLESSGEGNVQFNILLPTKELEKTEVKGFVDVIAEQISLKGTTHVLQTVTGRLGFSRSAIRANEIKGTFLGSPVSIDIVPSLTDEGVANATLLVANGVINNVGLETHAGVPEGILLGQTDWRCIVRFPSGAADSKDVASVIVESNLVGMDVALPRPFSVGADEKRNLGLEFRFPESGEIDTELSLGDDIRMVGNLKKSDDGSWSVARANLNFGPDFPALTSTDRLVISGSLPVLDLDSWLNLESSSGNTTKGFVRSINLKSEKLIIFGQEFNDVGFKLDHNVREWLVQLSGQQVEGSIFVPLSAVDNVPIIVDMTRLHLAKVPDDEKVEQDDADPRELASLQIKIADFVYGDMHFGGLEAQIQREVSGLRLTNMRTTAPSFETDASGHWLFGANGHRSKFDLKLISADVASTMLDLGYGDTLSADNGALTLNLSWDGPPDKNFLSRMSGSGSVEISKGQLASVKPKAGRVFGLLSVAALPRRLSLDFRDVFDKGLGFDSISGDFEFKDGSATTENLVLAGPAADVGIVGRTGLVDRDYDQTAVVRADIGNSLPIAGALVAGPGAGAALLVISQILKKPLSQITAVQYRITGSWDEPTVEQLGVAGRQGNTG